MPIFTILATLARTIDSLDKAHPFNYIRADVAMRMGRQGFEFEAFTNDRGEWLICVPLRAICNELHAAPVVTVLV